MFDGGEHRAAIAPPLVGFVHDATKFWTPAMLVILASVLTFTFCTTSAVRLVPKGR